MQKNKHKLGIDLGGTKIEICVLDQQQELLRRRIDTPAHSYEAILTALKDLVLAVDNELGQQLPVGIGTPGAISPKTGLMRNSNTVCLNGMPLLDDLQAVLERPVKIENDANCFALSEAIDGAGKQAKTVFGVIIGTGTGGAIVHQQQLLTGAHAIAGEWGHNPLPWLNKQDDPLQQCYCGKQGCIETFLSGPGMQAQFERQHGVALSSRQIVAQAQQGIAACEAFMDYYYDCVSRALAHVINMLDPDAIVLGGGMSNIDALYSEIPQRLSHYVFSDFVETPVIKAQHGDSSGVRGAAWLW